MVKANFNHEKIALNHLLRCCKKVQSMHAAVSLVQVSPGRETVAAKICHHINFSQLIGNIPTHDECRVSDRLQWSQYECRAQTWARHMCNE